MTSRHSKARRGGPSSFPACEPPLPGVKAPQDALTHTKPPRRMAPGGIEPPRVDSKSTALSTELRGRAGLHGILWWRVVAVAQLVEPRVVIPVVAGSSPVRHPVSFGTFPASVAPPSRFLGRPRGRSRLRAVENVRHTRYGYWLEEAGPIAPTEPLAEDTKTDVVVVGAGYLGLWTALAAQSARARDRCRRARRGALGARAERKERGLRLDSVGRPPDPARPRRRHAGGRGVPRIRAKNRRDRGMVRVRRGRRLVRPGTDALRRHVRRPGRGLGRDRRASARRSVHPRRRDRSAKTSPGSLRAPALPGRRPAPQRPRTCNPPGSPRTAGQSARAGRSPPRANARPRIDRDGTVRTAGDQPRRHGGRAPRRQQRDAVLRGLSPGARRRVEPHGDHRARGRRPGGHRLDGGRVHRRLSHVAALPPDDPRRADRTRLGRRPDGLRRPPHQSTRPRRRAVANGPND